MRYHLVALMLLVLLIMLPMRNALAAPAPPPSAILDIGPPPKEKTAEQYRKEEIQHLTHPMFMLFVWYESDVKKLPSVARLEVKAARTWLSENLQVTPVPGTSRLRLRFRAGSRAEQVTILNALLRVSLFWRGDRIKHFEGGIHVYEQCMLDLEKRLKSSRTPWETASYQKAIDDLRSIHIPAKRAVIARLKKFAVIRWAK